MRAKRLSRRRARHPRRPIGRPIHHRAPSPHPPTSRPTRFRVDDPIAAPSAYVGGCVPGALVPRLAGWGAHGTSCCSSGLRFVLPFRLASSLILQPRRTVLCRLPLGRWSTWGSWDPFKSFSFCPLPTRGPADLRSPWWAGCRGRAGSLGRGALPRSAWLRPSFSSSCWRPAPSSHRARVRPDERPPVASRRPAAAQLTRPQLAHRRQARRYRACRRHIAAGTSPSAHRRRPANNAPFSQAPGWKCEFQRERRVNQLGLASVFGCWPSSRRPARQQRAFRASSARFSSFCGRRARYSCAAIPLTRLSCGWRLENANADEKGVLIGRPGLGLPACRICPAPSSRRARGAWTAGASDPARRRIRPAPAVSGRARPPPPGCWPSAAAPARVFLPFPPLAHTPKGYIISTENRTAWIEPS